MANQKYNFHKLIENDTTLFLGETQNLRVAANSYAKRHGLIFNIVNHKEGILVTLINKDSPLYVKPLIPFSTKSNDVYFNSFEQFEILENYRNNLDQRMINNTDKLNDKCFLFEESRKVTKFINQSK